MKRIFNLTFAVIVLVGCTSNLQPRPPATATVRITDTIPTPKEPTGNVYDPDPNHTWNLVFRQFYRRLASDGKEYGLGELDPLLWFDTTYLLNEDSHQRAIQVLDKFLTTHAENLIDDPIKRAMFQRDLWAVFDWLASQSDSYPSQRQALEARLARIIRMVALTKEQIVFLPDNYALAVQSHIFPADYQFDNPKAAFLPDDLFEPDSAWVPMGREGGPIAMTHTEAFPFFGRSVFLVFVRSPRGQAATLGFIESLNTESNPVTVTGSDVALVRRMLLIDNEGDLTLSPLVESIQIRHFSPAQIFHEFELNRERLFDGFAGGLDLKTAVFPLFMGHGDVFENPIPELQVTIPALCTGCHFEYPPIPNSGNTHSIISYSRQPFSLPDNQRPILFATTLTDEAQTVTAWKLNHHTWQDLKTFWDQ